MSTGTVKWFDATKGYGFIERDGGGADVFVHISAVEHSGLDTLRMGDRISFEITTGRTGKPQAEAVKRIPAWEPVRP